MTPGTSWPAVLGGWRKRKSIRMIEKEVTERVLLTIGILCLIGLMGRSAFALERTLVVGESDPPFWDTCQVTDSFPLLVSTDQPESSAKAERVEENPPPAQPVAKESFFSKDYFKLLVEDTKFVLTAPTRWEKKDWLAFSVAAGGIAAVSLLDKPVWDLMRHNKSKTADRITDMGANVGGVYSLGILVPFYVAGEALDNPKAKSVALDGLASSMIAAGIITPALKFVASRSAPRDDAGTYNFHPFTYRFQTSGGPQSFPSGHAAQSFAIGSVIAAHYDEPWVKITAYSVASLASFSRIYQGVHFLSDWTAGALIGTVVGQTVVRFNENRRKERREQSVFILPFVIPGGLGLTVSFRLDKL